MQLKTPDITGNTFIANGKRYFIEGKISIDRKIYSDKLLVEVASGSSVGESFNDLKKLFDLLNEKKFAECAVKIHDKMNGLKNWKERKDTVLSLCALYINREDEDRRVITDEIIKDKIADWQEEGIEYNFFLTMAYSLLRGLIKIWNDTSQIDSEAATNEESNQQERTA